MTDRLKNKVAIITGAARGIGKAAAIIFAKEGAKVVIADLDDQGALNVVNQIKADGNEAMYVRTNLTSASDVEALVAQTVETYGKLDILYNNAGINLFAQLADTEEEDWDKVMQVNVKSVYLTCKYAIPVMKERGYGVILNTASAAAIVGLRNLAAYTASKGAVLQLTRNIALDYAKYGIRVNAICPGVTATEMTEKVILDDPDPVAARARFDRVIPRGTMAVPSEIAMAALFL
ncbi:MAG: glucose 1-dehydrogenase, partial [bacterium]